MEFQNQTNCDAVLLRNVLETDVVQAAAIARVRYRLAQKGLEPLPQPDPHESLIRTDAIEDEYGRLEADSFFPRVGTDLIILGDAISTRGPLHQAAVNIDAGPYKQRLSIFGRRVWKRGLLGLVPTEPDTFERIPLTYAHAFGGKAKTEYGPRPDARNPSGIGYYTSEDQALGHELPRIENPEHLIARWDDRPDPVGVAPYPRQWTLRSERLVRVDPDTRELSFSFDGGMYDLAHPWLSGKRLQAGERVRISGMSENGPVTFLLPECPFEIDVQLGTKRHTRDLWLEEVLVDLRAGYVDLTYRKMFHYDYVRHQKRETALRYQRRQEG